MADQPRKRRSERNEQIPQRVENAAQNMYASSGPRRGYVPGGYALTGTTGQENGWAQTGNQTGGQQSNSQMPYTGGYSSQQPYGGMQSQMTGAQRGYRVQTIPPQQQQQKKKKNHAVAVIVVLLVLAGLGTGGYFAAKNYLHEKTINEKIQPYDGLFCPNVYVDGIHLGGMTPEQAMNSVQSQIQQRHDAWKVSLTWNGSVVAEINSDMLGFNVDPAQVMNEAWQQGHAGDKEQRYEQMIQLEQTPYVAYTAKPDGDTSIIDTKLSEIKNAIDQPATDAVMTGFDPSLDYPFTFTDETYGRVLNIEPIKDRLYQAAVCAGLQILKREPHSDSVSYAEYGKDATVYWVGKRKIDLTFKNNTDDPIYIVAAVQKDPSNKKRLIAKVSMYGQDMGDVRYELQSEITETLPAPFNPVYVKDTNGTYVTYKDQQESVSKAKEGYVVKSYRLKYDGIDLTEKKELFTDRYEPKPEKIYVGVKDR